MIAATPLPQMSAVPTPRLRSRCASDSTMFVDPAAQRDSGSPDTREAFRLRLKTPPRVPRFMYGVAVLTAMTFIMVWGGQAEAWGGPALLIAVGIAGGAIPLILTASREPPPVPIIELGFDRLRLPRTAELADQIDLKYREIDSLFLRPGRSGFVWIGTASATFMYPVRRFLQPEDAQRLHSELQVRISERLPDGDQRLESFENAATQSLSAYRRALPATIVLVTMIIAATVLTTTLRAYTVFNLVHAGALVPSLVLEHGQWWRIGTAAWLSMPPDGLIAATTIGVFGMMVERLFGSLHVLAVAGLAVALGAGMSLVSGESVSFGATPIALGLFAGMAFVAQARPGLLPVGFRPPGVWWVVTGGLLAMLSLLLSNQDPSMLVGGAIAGVVVTALRLHDDVRLPISGRTPIALMGISALFVGGTAVGWVQGFVSFRAPLPVEATALLSAAQERGWGHQGTWNELAWRIAIEPQPAEADLASAGVLAERAVGRANDIADPDLKRVTRNAYVDTLATVRYRQRRFDEAIRLQRDIIASTPNAVYATQLARFLDGRVAAGSSTVTAQLPSLDLTYNDNRGFALVVDAPVERPVTVWAVVKQAEELRGLLRLSLKPTTPVGEKIWLRQRGTDPKWPPDVRLVPADVRADKAEWTAWGVDEETASLPRVSGT